MARSPFASARRLAGTGAVASVGTWSPGARTLRQAQERQRAGRRAASRPKMQTDPLTVRALTAACKAVGRTALWLMTMYPLARLFVLAHAGGIVGHGQALARHAACAVCPFSYTRGGREYCRGANAGRGCGCGHWPASRLGYKLTLAAFRCPQKRFGYGGLAVWLFGK